MSLVTKLPDSAKTRAWQHHAMAMTDVSFTDSSGLAVLVAAYKGVKESNGCAVLLSPQPNVQSLLELTRLQELFEIFEDENTAVKRVSEP